MDLLDEIGLNDNSWTVSLSEAIEIGINDFQNQFNGLTRQMAAIGIATGANMINDISKNTSINVTDNSDILNAFEFKNNINDMDSDFEITLVIYTDPTLPKVQKNLVKVLRNAEDNNGVKLFDAGQVVNIITQLKDAYSQKKDRDIDLTKFKFKIHFEIEGFNKTQTEDIIEKVTEMLQELEEKRKREKEQAINTFELGVMTEEYTLDPTMAKRRPTI
jgi:paraquat-inducible protein B